MTGSAEERAMRDGIIPVLREICPGARIIHELNIDHGHCRADIAAVEKQRVTLVEIKSKKDKLDRLDKQLTVFGRAAHQVILLADEKWFGEKFGSKFPQHFYGGSPAVWRWPRPESASYAVKGGWHTAWLRHNEPEPHARRLLELLWRDELETECRSHAIAVSGRTPRFDMIRDMAWLMTGREVVEAVCRQLRSRPFAEADAPIIEKALAA